MLFNSLGIIGGADGPTAILVSGSPWPLILAAIALAGGIIFALKALYKR